MPNENTINPKIKLSILWITVIFNMAYADILGFLDAEFLKSLMTGYAGEIKITEEFILIAAIMLEIPIIMTLLSRLLERRINRILNIIAPIITIAFVIAGGHLAYHYIFFASIETLLMLYIIWTAWHWNTESK